MCRLGPKRNLSYYDNNCRTIDNIKDRSWSANSIMKFRMCVIVSNVPIACSDKKSKDPGNQEAS